MRSWTVGGVIGVLLVWLLLSAALFSVPGDATFRGPEAAFVPASGSAARIAIGEGTPTAASAENALISGIAIVEEIPAPIVQLMRPPEGVPQARLRWWRQTISPDTAASSVQMILRAVTPDGVHLTAQTGPAGAVFRPALLELPAEIAAGVRWESSGRVFDQIGEADYHHVATAQPAPDPWRDRGCLEVTSTITIRSLPREQRAVWCPGEGIVDGQTGLGIPVSPLPTDHWPWATRTAPVTRWPTQGTAETPALVEGDVTFGTGPAVTDLPRATAVTAGGVLVGIGAGGDGVVGWTASAAQEPVELTAVWWAHPGGAILSLTTVDNLVFVTTSERRLVAYDQNGRRLWSHATPDLVTGSVTDVGEDRLVLATVAGDLVAHRIANGDRLWRADFDGGADQPVIVQDDLLLVRTKEETLAAFGPDGVERWTTDELLTSVGAAQAGDRLFLLSRSGEAVLLDAATGRLVATGVVGFGAAHTSLVPGPDGSAAVVGEDGVRIVAAHSGHEVGFVAGGAAVVADGDGWRVLTPNALLALDARGVERSRIALTPAVEGGTGMTLAGDVLWVLQSGGVTWVR